MKAAYAKTGLKPIRKTYLSDDRTCGCAIGAMALAGGVDPSCSERGNEFAKNLYGEWYRLGFVHGFDGTRLSSLSKSKLNEDSDRELYGAGYADGRAVAAAIFGEEA